MQNDNKAEARCHVCQKLSTLKCSGCNLRYYCNKRHQRQDWPMHKPTCRTWEIQEDHDLGRYLVAAKDIEPGDIIVSELPLVWGPAFRTEDTFCIGCGKQCAADGTVCPKCLWPACDAKCRSLLDQSKHGPECRTLTFAKLAPRCDYLLLIRMLCLWRAQSVKWRQMMELESHEAMTKSGKARDADLLELEKYFENFWPDNPATEDIIRKICGLIDINAMETMPPEGSMAIYKTACLLEHNCLPNTSHSFSLNKHGPRITVKAACPIKKGDHLTTMYANTLWDTKVRQQYLLLSKFFLCRCKRCADPTEFGTHLGTLKCLNDNGFILPKDPLVYESEWSCDSCSVVLTSAEVEKLVLNFSEEYQEIMTNPAKDKLSAFLSRLTRYLHPGHQWCTLVGLSLIQLLEPTDPQKYELCKRILRTLTTLDPYGTRMGMHAAVALRELARCPGQDKKALLSRAISLIESEPPDSPGGRFLIILNSDLSKI